MSMHNHMNKKKKLTVTALVVAILALFLLPFAANFPNTLRGDTGATGATGATGPTGPQGETGPESTVTYIFWINGTTAQNFQVTCTATKEQLNSATNQTFTCTVVVS